MKKAFFYGDSNTFGYDPAGFMGGRYPYAARWTTILQENLAGEWEIESDGMPGRALPITQYEWNYIRSLVRQAMPFDVFGVMLGTNDLLSTLYPDAAKAMGRMNALLDFVRRSWKEAAASPSGSLKNGNADEKARALQLLLIAPPKVLLTDLSYGEPYVTGDRTYAQIYYEEARRLSQYYRALAASRGDAFADAFSWDLEFAFDGVHLSEAGHAAFARQMTDVMRRL